MSNALRAAIELGCATIALFVKNSTQWQPPRLEPREIEEFKRLRRDAGISPIVAHASYLINLASPDRAQYRRSIKAFRQELEAAELLGIDCMVVHPGAYMGSPPGDGMRRIADAINLLHSQTVGYRVMICLETSAGQGTSLGWRFEQLAAMLEPVEAKERIGICIDTCHIFAAGYDIRTPQAYQRTIAELESMIGIEKVKALHVNDSKKALGCRVDRHEHIGRGHIGEAAFALLLNDRRFAGLPMILETPKDPHTLDPDRENLAVLRRLAGSNSDAAT